MARALVNAGALPADIQAKQAFYIATEFLSRPGVFGLILAALTAALMSTVDTLITAVSAIAVNDIYRPYIAPQATDRQSLRVARICALSVTIIGVLLVPIFMKFKSIYSAHGAFTAAVTPPLVVTILLSVFWRRFTRKAALATLVGGMLAIVVSLIFPQVISPFAHGVPMKETDGTLLAGITQYKFMRAFFRYRCQRGDRRRRYILHPTRIRREATRTRLGNHCRGPCGITRDRPESKRTIRSVPPR